MKIIAYRAYLQVERTGRQRRAIICRCTGPPFTMTLGGENQHRTTMSLFHIQYRRAKLEQGGLPTVFPEAVTLEIRFGPTDAFGVSCEPRTVAPRAQAAGMLLDFNEGITYLNAELIAKTTGKKEFGDLSASLDGNCLRLTRRVDSIDEAIVFATSANQLLPPLLSLRLHTFVWVKEFCLLSGSGHMRFKVVEIRYAIPTATTEGNLERVWTCIHDWGNIAPEHQSPVRCFPAVDTPCRSHGAFR